MKKSKLLLISIVLLLGTLNSNAQTSQVKIMDLGITPMNQVNQSNVLDSVDLSVQFKIKNSNVAQGVTLKLGLTQNGAEVLTRTLPVVNQSGNYGIMSLGNFYEINGNTALAIVRISKQSFTNTQWFSLYVTDTNGISTQEINVQK